MLIVVVTATKLRPYLQSHKIILKTDFPIRQVLKKPDLASIMISWSVALSEHDNQFVRRVNIKSQVLDDFVVEYSSPSNEEVPFVWILSVDGSSNLKGSGGRDSFGRTRRYANRGVIILWI